MSLSTNVDSIAALKGLSKTTYDRAFVIGYYTPGDGGGGNYWYDPSDTTSADDGGTVIVATDGGRWKLVIVGSVTLKQFGAKGNNVADDTAAILKAKAWVAAHLPATIRITPGTYRYTDIGNWNYSGFSMIGEEGAVLKCISTAMDNTALLIWAFESGSPTAPFVQGVTIKNLVIEGNANTIYGIRLYGVARSQIENVRVKNCKTSDGTAFLLNSCSINTFIDIACSTDRDVMTSIPLVGLSITNGYRAGIDMGQSTNNVFVNARMEGVPQGFSLLLADQNTFIGGTAESNTVRGVALSATARFNAFIGFGMENSGSVNNLLDAGYSNQLINCYSLNSLIFQGEGCKVSGGIHERIEIQAGAIKNCFENLATNYVGGGSGGFYDSGTATEWKNIKNKQTSSYIYPLKARTNIPVGSSPFTWANATGQYVEVIVQGGSVSQVRQSRSGDFWLKPASGPTVHLLPPGDALETTYSSSPSISYVPHNGFQG
ncbi:hypothetical protein [Roseateles sp. P5_E1]